MGVGQLRNAWYELSKTAVTLVADLYSQHISVAQRHGEQDAFKIALAKPFSPNLALGTSRGAEPMFGGPDD
jgi:hypothetical protein